MKPSVGRIVHWRPKIDQDCRAALVTHVDDDAKVTVTVFEPSGLTSVVFGVPIADEAELAGAHWPERVEG
jgi:hypothetical protein